MNTSTYTTEKIAAYNRHDALAAAEQSRLAREARRPQQDTTTAPTGIRIPRQRRWLGLAWHGTALSGR